MIADRVSMTAAQITLLSYLDGILFHIARRTMDFLQEAGIDVFSRGHPVVWVLTPLNMCGIPLRRDQEAAPSCTDSGIDNPRSSSCLELDQVPQAVAVV